MIEKGDPVDRKQVIFKWLVNTDKEDQANQLLEYALKYEQDISELTNENERLQGLFREISQLNLDEVTPSRIIEILHKSRPTTK